MSGSTGSATGFNFSAAPLTLNGQQVGASFNFDLPVVAASSATDAYGFVSGINDSAQSFLNDEIVQADSYTQPLLAAQTNYLAQIGNSFGAAANTAAGKISTSSNSGIFGSILGGLGSFL